MAKVMTKPQTLAHLAGKLGMTKKQAAKGLEVLAALAVRETKKSGQFIIPGIGKLVKVNRKARQGRNPATGEAIQIPGKTVVKFRVAKACKEAVAPRET